MSLLCVSVLCASLVTQPAEEHTLAPAVTKDDKQAALNAAVVADNEVLRLERQREDTWVGSRQKLMTAASPAIRAEHVLAVLNEETSRFSTIEQQISNAKKEQQHKHRIADITSEAWSAQEQSRLLARRATEAAEEATRQEKAAQAAREAQILAIRNLAKEQARDVTQ